MTLLPTVPKEFMFDMTLSTSIRVTATSEAEARSMLKEALDCADTNFGAWPNGDPILGEASMIGKPTLVEVDGEFPPPSIEFLSRAALQEDDGEID